MARGLDRRNIGKASGKDVASCLLWAVLIAFLLWLAIKSLFWGFSNIL